MNRVLIERIFVILLIKKERFVSECFGFCGWLLYCSLSEETATVGELCYLAVFFLLGNRGNRETKYQK